MKLIVTKVVKEWFANANEDLRAAHALHQIDPKEYLRTIPYLCQQTVEKSVKGYLAYKKIKFPKTHDIGVLTTLLLSSHPELLTLFKKADGLSIYAVEFRYPGVAKREPTIKTSKNALKIAKEIFEVMTTLIPFDTQWKI